MTNAAQDVGCGSRERPAGKIVLTTHDLSIRDCTLDITHEMVSAGVSALERYQESYDPWLLVQAAYSAMIDSRQLQPPREQPQDRDD